MIKNCSFNKGQFFYDYLLRDKIMKIKSLEIIGLNGSEQPINLTFNDDLNIITGRNGAGKTTILKMIWGVISGNFAVIKRDCFFDKLILKTDGYKVVVAKNNEPIIEFYKDPQDILSNNLHKHFNFRPIDKVSYYSSSLFFPTFRRIEHNFFSNDNEEFEQDLNVISSNVSTPFHKFIFTIGTRDIENLLTKKYSQIIKEIDKKQFTFSENILHADEDTFSFKTIQNEVQKISKYRQEKMQPFSELHKLLQKFLKNKNVNFGDINSLTIGDTTKAIESDLLSAGEKQMLSFLAYNAVYNDTIFIIDEPELSLHGDWQRLLIPTLLKQNPSNQFIMATHSPFIYSKYPDKELRLVSDRGNTDNKQYVITRGKHG